jgi:Lon-like protease
VNRYLTPARLAIAGLALILLVALVLWLVPSNSYLLLPDQARPTAPLVKVPKDKAKGDDKGRIYFLAVLVRKANLLERLIPAIRGDGATLVPASALRPPGVSERTQRKIDEHAMSESQSVAAAVVLQALHRDVGITPAGAPVDQVLRQMPASGKLRSGDLIVGLDGKRVETSCGLRNLMASKRPGQEIRLAVKRGDSVRDVTLRPVADPSEHDRPVIGILLGQNTHVRLPFPIKINAGTVTGPSAGLPFALEIMEKLGHNVDRGHRIAATGELQLGGCVLPIGGVKQKTIEARRSHVDILLVPAGDNAAEARKYAGAMRVIPVNTFQQALRKLATVPPKA